MNLKAVKAAELRAKYIIDKHHYGVECNTCDYNYAKWAMSDFVAQCFDVCDTPKFSNSIYGSQGTIPGNPNEPVLLDCAINVTQTVIPACTPPTIIPCVSKVTYETNLFEGHYFLIAEIDGFGESIEWDMKMTVNGEFVLDDTLLIDPSNINITNNTVTNIVDFLNSNQSVVLFENIVGSGETWKMTSLRDLNWVLSIRNTGNGSVSGANFRYYNHREPEISFFNSTVYTPFSQTSINSLVPIFNILNEEILC